MTLAKERRKQLTPHALYMEELRLALLARPETEPLGRRLVDQLNGLLDLPVGVACAILFEFQGRARADCELSLLEFLAGRVARWKLGPERGIDRMDVVRS